VSKFGVYLGTVSKERLTDLARWLAVVGLMICYMSRMKW
jgi:hypothetical protein